MFDPDITGVGHQPLGFDQWSAFYNKYTVYGSKCQITILNATGSTAATQNIEAVLMPVPSSVSTTVITTATDLEELYEFPYSKMKAGNIVGGAPNLFLKSYMSTTKIDGIPKAKVGISDSYSAVNSANPSNMWRWAIGLQSTDEAATSTCRVLVKMTYYARMWDRTVLTQS